MRAKRINHHHRLHRVQDFKPEIDGERRQDLLAFALRRKIDETHLRNETRLRIHSKISMVSSPIIFAYCNYFHI